MSSNHIAGIPSGFAGLDNMTSGFQRSEFIVIGGRPSVGKTAIALSMAAFISAKKIPLEFFTLEMSESALLKRMPELETHNKKSLFIIDTPGISLSALCAKARLLKTHEKIEIIFIDYLPLIKSDTTGARPRSMHFKEVSQSLKNLARELDIPIVALAQLGKAINDSDPKVSDIHEGRDIARLADTIIFLIREKDSNKVTLRVAKHRNGETGDADMVFLPMSINKDKCFRQ